jgi:ferrous iron transport protein B
MCDSAREALLAAGGAVTVALVGNPNTGKTALFNALTGFRRHVANYPGVTVEIARGPIRKTQRPLELIDSPGTYSLAGDSPDERVVLDTLQGSAATGLRPAAAVVVVDASNLVRNLYLVSQVLEQRIPCVIALNMIDVARARGIHVDAARLAERLGVPVVPVIATQPRTVSPLVRAIEAAVAAAGQCHGRVCLARTAPAAGDAAAVAAAEVRARYHWVHEVLAGVLERAMPRGPNWSDRIDALVTHPLTGTLALLVVLYGIFALLFRGAEPLMRGMEWVFGWLGARIASLLPPGVVQSFLADGLLAGVGGVLQFLPQILILFLFIALLEDSGYLARMAFMVDRLMRPLGLSGRAFIPLLSSFACAVPAILGTRAIADRRERLITILIAPFMSCSARLPVYVLFVGAFVPARAWLGGWLRLDALVMFALYLVGVVVAIPVALLLKWTVRQGPTTGFVLELPAYKWPRLRAIWQRMYLAGRSFVVRAGTIILVVNLAVWALGYFPHSTRTRAAVEAAQRTQGRDGETSQRVLAGAYLRDSYLGRIGHALEPAIRPLGWDWRIGIGVIASFPAREVIVATLGTVANLGRAKADAGSLREGLRRMTREDTGQPLFTLPVALSIVVFFALCAQCAGTLTMIGRETGSWTWALASFATMTTLAYVAAWGVSAGARALGA